MSKNTENTLDLQQVNKQQQELKTQLEQLDKQQLRQDDEAFELKQKTAQLAREQKEFEQSKQLLKKEKQWIQEQQEKLSKDSLVIQNQQNKKEEQLASQQTALEVRALEIENGLPDLAKQHVAEQVVLIEKRKQAFKAEYSQFLEQQEAFANKQKDLAAWEEQLTQLKQQADNDFAAQRAELTQELSVYRTEQISLLNLKMAQEEELARKKIEQSLAQQKLDLEQSQEELKQAQGILAAERLELQKAKAHLKQQQNDLERTISHRMIEERNLLEGKISNLEKHNELLLTQVKQADFSVKLYESLQRELGEQSPEEVIRLLTARTEEINRLQEELFSRPSEEIQNYYDEAKKQVDDLKHRNEQLNNKLTTLLDEVDGVDQIEYELNREKRSHENLQIRYDAISADNNQLREELKRLNPAYEEQQTREQRIAGVKREVIPFVNHKPLARKQSDVINELSWLQQIQKDTTNYGLYFSERILFAFHTALKTAEWSPLAVLAGVSGTGKSQLPKLYSHFGGINFLNVPVQPNWDSQESMLGYFNSIDNCFEAQPMLNFLAQSCESLVCNDDERYHGLNDTVSMVLLDEMNLAHVELYFADFLSKLEDRRGSSKSKLPSISIKLGSNIAPYEIPLGRNVLFAGTMNQDETTKSLSDKVIDRGTSIYFPRPTKLHERKKLKVLPKPAELLKMKSWSSWIKLESNLANSSYKETIESINHHLGFVGKALGHRVWQSIEYYMVNHPLVCALDSEQYPDEYKEALDFAFEDQIVQKVMPKLRGIETRGYGKIECLDKIRILLDEKKINLLTDFDHACRVGHGQFMWASAEYLNDENTNQRYRELVELAMKQSSRIDSPENKTPPVSDIPLEKQSKSSVVKNTFKSMLNNVTSKTDSTNAVSDGHQALPLTGEEFQRLSLYVNDKKLEINTLSISEVRAALESINCDVKKTKQVFDYLKKQG
ncbi:hypothetical protein [Vibrio cyclitrophicus]|uniref:hypothetical protein n=1 Tax=Vibrio cyclitrophicus TaxID=47951 RepID=UPI000C8491DF|nr:hypothetical protein [Vibrio cyclitrophicus]PMH74613.1 hypothetical protein BCU59_02255 [Vibrio cyclitrophicus]